MAEVFGAVASGAGLVSLAIQLLDSAQKLRKFGNSFRDAPSKLSQFAFDIETISLALRQIEADRMRHDVSDHDLLTRCLQTCQQSTEKITRATEKFDRLLSRSRAAAKITVAFKGPELEAMFVELEQAKTALHLAWSLYSESTRRHDFKIQQQALLALKHSMEQSFRQLQPNYKENLGPENRVHRLPGHDCDVEVMNSARYDHRKVTSKRRRSKPTFQACINLPSWVTDKIWNFAMTASEDGWTFTLSSIRIVSRDSEIFEACEEGDLQRVQKLFACGEASIHDDTGDGWSSPLLVAFWQGHQTVCRFLLSTGSRCDQVKILETIMSTVHACNWITFSHQIAEQLERGGFEVSAQAYPFHYEPANHAVLTFRSLVDLERHADMSVQDWPLKNRLAASVALDDVQVPQKFCEMFDLTSMSSLREACQQFGPELLITVLRKCLKVEYRPQSPWIEFAQQLEALGASISPEYAASAFHFLVLMECNTYTCTEDISTFGASGFFRDWIRQLHRSGADLNGYGSKELRKWAEHYEHNTRLQNRHWPFYQDGRRISFRYGPEVRDWSLLVDREVKIRRWVLQTPPGSWPERGIVPTTICWRPRARDETEGKWALDSEVTTLRVSERDECQPPGEEIIRDHPCDDTSLVALLAGREATSNPKRPRSVSQPPPRLFKKALLLNCGYGDPTAVGPMLNFCYVTFRAAYDAESIRRHSHEWYLCHLEYPEQQQLLREKISQTMWKAQRKRKQTRLRATG